MADRQLVEQLTRGKPVREAQLEDPRFSNIFFDDLAAMLKIYTVDEIQTVYRTKAKVMLEMDFFDERDMIRAPRNPQEVQRFNHNILTRLADTNIDVQKILIHMGMRNYPVKGKEDLKYVLAQTGRYIG